MTHPAETSGSLQGSRPLLPFYYHATFFLSAALLTLHTVLSFLVRGGIESGPILLGVEGSLALVAVIGNEIERGRVGSARPATGGFLGLFGLLQIALCVVTGGLSSPYFLLVACTGVFAGLTLSAPRAAYVSTILATAYVGGVWFLAKDLAVRSEAESLTAIIVHVAFLLLATALALRVARRHRATVATLAVQSKLDPLTSLENRRAFLAKMENELQRAERFSWPITMLILDLDHFKKMNDEHGHAMGDAVLVAVADLLKATVGPVDHIARVGGEEFAVAAVAAEPHHGRDLADRLVRAFRSNHWSSLKSGLKVTVSIGVAVLPPGHHSVEPTSVIREIMERADRSLYWVKQNGRDGFHVAGEDMRPAPGHVSSAS